MCDLKHGFAGRRGHGLSSALMACGVYQAEGASITAKVGGQTSGWNGWLLNPFRHIAV
jgi:hypothetical protein